MTHWGAWRGKARAGRTVRREVGRMNRTEALYDAHLQTLLLTKEILWYAFERVKLRLADNTHLTIDFVVVNKDGVVEFHEVKGYMEDDAAVKIKVAADMFPFRFFVVRSNSGGWTVEEI